MRGRSREQETEDVNERRLRRGAVKRLHIAQNAVGSDELADGIVGEQHLGARIINETHLHPDVISAMGAGLTITLGRESAQSIPAGGAAIDLTDYVTGPRRIGFDDVVLPVSSISFPVECVATFHVRFRWDGWRAGGTVQLKRDGTVVDESPQSWGPQFDGVLHASSVLPGEALSVVVDHGDTSAHDVTDVRVAAKVEGAVSQSAATAAVGLYTVSFLPVAGELVVARRTAAGGSELQSVAFASSIATWYSLRASVIGGRIRARAWVRGTSEPGAWQIDVTDPAPLGAGMTGVTCSPTSPTDGTRQYDTLEVAFDGAPAVDTDFSEYPIGGLPAGWGRLFGANELWEIVADAGATGGQVLRYPTSVNSGSFVGWQAAGIGFDTEVLAGVRTAHINDAVGVVLRGSSLL